MDKNTTVRPVFKRSYVEFEHLTRLPYRCQSGYQYDESVTNIPNLVCMNGVWSGDNKCSGKCTLYAVSITNWELLISVHNYYYSTNWSLNKHGNKKMHACNQNNIELTIIE